MIGFFNMVSTISNIERLRLYFAFQYRLYVIMVEQAQLLLVFWQVDRLSLFLSLETNFSGVMLLKKMVLVLDQYQEKISLLKI
jgi:hypothetical protein